MSRLHTHVKKLSEKLVSPSINTVYNALVELRTKILKTPRGVQVVVEEGTVSKIIDVLKRNSDTTCEEYSKIVNITASIIGNLCMEEQARNQVLQCGGIFILERYFSESTSESVQNRCCRALANLALSAQACEVIHRTDVLSHLVLLLEQTKDKECIQTYCRATRLFGRTKDQRDKIVTKGAILQVAKQVSSEDTDIKKVAVRTLFELSKSGCSFEFSEQVVSAAAIKELVAIVIRDDSTEICQQSLQVLFELICHPNTRPVFGAAGGIQVFIDRFHTEETQNTRLSILNVLCLCTKESVNRAKLRTNGALILFLETLQSKTYCKIHDRVISSLVNFMYDENSLEILLENNLVSILLNHLQRVADFECKILTTDNFEDCFNGESSWNFDSELFPEEDSIFHKFYPGEYSCSSEEISHENPENVVSQMTDCEFDNDQRNLYSIDSPTYTANKLWTLEDSDTLCKTNFSNDMTSMKSSSLSPLSTITYMSPEFSPTRPQFSSPSSPSCDFSGTSSTCHYPSVLSTPYSPIKSCHTSPISSPGLSPDSLSYSNNQEDLFSESEEEEDVIVGEHDIEEDMETGDKVTDFDPSITDVINQDNKETVAPTLSPHIKPNENVSNKNIQPECDCELPAFDVVGKSRTESSRSTEESQPSKRRRVAVSSESTSHIQDNSISTKKIQKSNSVTNRVSCKKERKEPTITENHILIILSRISHMDDPSKILVTKETICCLLDYIKNVDFPEKRAARILSRLIQNPLCFEKFLILNAPLSVFFKLLYNEDDESIELNIQKLQTHVTSKRDQRRSVRSRSSSCSLESSDFLDVEDDNCRENRQSKPDKEVSYGTDSGQLLKPSNEENLENEHFLISQTEDEGLRCTQDDHISQENCRESLESSCSTLFEKEKISIRSGLVFLHELSIQAESPFGRGVVAHLCHRKTEKEKLWMKITLLFMIWTKSSFKHYMMERGVLKDITHILLSTGNDAVEDLCSTSQYQVSLTGLCFLGHIIPKSTFLVGDRQSSMKSSVPYLDTVDALKPRFESETSGCHLRQTSRTNFALRIGNDRIRASREILVKSSPIFEAMLSGHYAEAQLTEVALSDTTYFAANYIIHYLHGCHIDCDVIAKVLNFKPTDQNLCHCLEGISLAHKFMLNDLEKFLRKVLIGRMLDTETVCHVFQFAKVHDFQDLQEQSVKLIFQSKSMKSRVKGFKKIILGPNNVEFMNMIPEIFLSS